MRTTNLSTVIIYTTNMEALADFYRKGLDLGDPVLKDERHIGFQAGGIYFGFDRVTDRKGSPPSAITIWFHVASIDATFDKLKSLGAKVEFEPTQKPWGDTIACLLDPDGNLFGIAQPTTETRTELDP